LARPAAPPPPPGPSPVGGAQAPKLALPKEPRQLSIRRSGPASSPTKRPRVLSIEATRGQHRDLRRSHEKRLHRACCPASPPTIRVPSREARRRAPARWEGRKPRSWPYRKPLPPIQPEKRPRVLSNEAAPRLSHDQREQSLATSVAPTNRLRVGARCAPCADARYTPPRATGTAAILCVSRSVIRSKYAASGSGRSMA
jgi:hypothetical protein